MVLNFDCYIVFFDYGMGDNSGKCEIIVKKRELFFDYWDVRQYFGKF